MKKVMKTRIFCILLLLAMLLQMFPLYSFGEESENVETGEGENVEDDALENDGEIEIDYSNAVPVTSADELAVALAEGQTAIRIDADFLLDRTFYVTKSTVIVADAAHTLKRAPSFGGDIFLVGEESDGSLVEERVVLTVGKPDDATPSMIVIDGDSENVTAEVVGTVFFVCGGSRVDLYSNVTVKNHVKTGNERTFDTEKYGLSYPIRVGGAVAIVASKATMRIFGGLYQNNAVNGLSEGETDDEKMRCSWGGAFYNFGSMDVYGGLFEGNYAARAGVFYNYRTLNLYNAQIVNNTAASLGGAIYVPASTAAYLYLGEDNDVVDSQVVFEGNFSVSSGGAIYMQHVASVKNTVFRNNTTETGHGGAIAANATELEIADTVFEGNTASDGRGGALWFSDTTDSDTRDLIVSDVEFTENSAAYGGAVYMNKGAKTYFAKVNFEGNSSDSGGVFYATGEGTLLEVNGATVTKNTSTGSAGALYLTTSASAIFNNVVASENTAQKGGGFAYVSEAELTLYDSTVEKSSATTGGAVNVQTSGVLNAYNTKFVRNQATSTQGGALMLYTGGTESTLHSCVFEGNNAANFGGAIYISNKSLLNMYNVTAMNNSALKGGFMYHTTTGTTVHMIGATVSGNTSVEGGDIIWGNSAGAKLYIDKLKYVDNSYTGDWDDTYWAYAIYNALTVYDVRETIPPYVAYGTGELVEPPAPQSVTDVKSAAELERALEVGYTIIRLAADFELDRTFFVTSDVTIFATQDRILKRAVGFGGDIFVVGMTADGTRVENAVFTLGKADGTDASLTIDGNAALMTVDVVGTVVLVCDDARADLGTKLCMQNHHKDGNERLLNGFSVSNYPDQVGGAVGVIEQGGEMNIYGGSYLNNTATAGDKISYGGAFFNHSKLNVYGGLFEGNSAGRGGAFYNYRTMWMYGGEVRENSASTFGGAIYIPNTTAAYLYICNPDMGAGNKVYFIENTAVDGGGAIYARNFVYITNTVFEGNSVTNTSENGFGGAIYALSTRMTVDGCMFRNNTASRYGGALYLSGTNGNAETPELTVRNSVFEGNSANSRAGVMYMSSEARAYFKDSDFTRNTSVMGGAFYVNASSLEIDGANITGNSASTGTGAFLYLVGRVPDVITEENPVVRAYFLANHITATNNTAANYGGFIYLHTATAEIYNSEFTSNAAKIGGVAYVTTDAIWKSYNTLFKSNTAETDGGALHIYPGATESVIHSCTFEENTAGAMGGALKVNGEAQLDMYNITAIGNKAAQGGFMYETKAGTVVKIVGITLSGNTATTGGPIIWGNTLNAKLYIDKSQYRDLDATGKLDDAYWKAAIYNKLTVYEISEAIPKYLDYRNEAYDQMSDAIDVSNAEELEAAILSGNKHIRIVADILIDRTFYITGDTTIFTTIGHTLKRAPSFGGDFFVVGEDAAGKSSLFLGNNAKLTLGNPYSVAENFLVIDGNRDNMTVDVVGSVLFIAYSARADLHKNVTVMNCYKVGNERTLDEKYRLSIENRIGATLAVVASGTLNVYGGIYKNNGVNEEVINGTDETGRNSTVGGLIFNSSNVNIYGGTFENNQAARGGVIYNYRIARIFGGTFTDNVATVSGGVYYAPNSAQVHLYVGSADADGEKVIFENNRAKSSGGVIYASTRSANVIYGNTSFIGNTVTNGSGGAIAAYGQLTVRDTTFDGNSASNRGGAIYASNSLIEDTVRLIEITRCTFKNNKATLGGAISLYAGSVDCPTGAVLTLTNSTFTGNAASVTVANASDAYGGALYLDRKASLTAVSCTFDCNEASTEAGAIYIAGESKAEILDAVITKNKAGKYGGAIVVRSSYLNIDGTDITENSAVSNGGAIYVSYQSAREINAKVLVTNSLFEANTTESKGGAIYATRRDITDAWNILTVKNTEFKNNIAATDGGAIHTLVGVGGYFENVSFLGNSVTGESADGGAVCAYGSKLEFNGGTFANNSSLSSGGAIYLTSTATALLNNVTATANTANSGGFIYATEATLSVYNSTVDGCTANTAGGAINAQAGAVLNVYNSSFSNNTAMADGGALHFYTGAMQSIVHSCTFEGNTAGNMGGALKINGESLVDIYNITAIGNSAAQGGFMYETKAGTVVKLVGVTLSGNTATTGGPIIWGNTLNAKLYIDKTKYHDLDAAGTLNDAYWAAAIYNKLTVETTTASVPSYQEYKPPVVTVKEPTIKPAGSVDEIFALDGSTGSEYISSKYENLPVLDNSSNFMSDGITYFENVNGGTVTVDSFVYDTNAQDGNCTVGEGLLIYQAMLYKKAHPDEEVSIHLSAYRVSVEAAVNINRNNRYFGYMRNLGTKEYDANGFVRVSYLLVSAARMGINVTVIGQIDGYPRNGGPTLHKYFNDYLNTECDPKYAQGKVSDYMNFAECFWTLDSGKGGTDMMHTKLCAVSHYLDINGVAHKNAVFTTSSNLDGISSSGANGNYKLQTATIVSDHEYLYRVSTNYLNLVAAYCGQEQIYEFQDIMSHVGAEQIDLILAGRMNEIPENELLVYLGTENDDVFELYFTPFAGATAVWDEQNNPYCKYIREMYNSEGSIIFIWNAAEYNSAFPLGDQMEDIIVGSFFNNKNVENKFFGTMENFDKTKLDGLTVGVDIGYISVNKKPFGAVHNKDILLSYVKDGQRYYVSLLNSCNMHGGSMCYQSNFMLVIKETDCEEDSVFFNMADLTTTGIVEHTYGEETSFVPEDGSHGYYYLPCIYCDKQVITGTIHRPGEWIVDREATLSVTEIAHKACTDCGCTLEVRETALAEEELSRDLTEEKGICFAPGTMLDTGVLSTPKTLEAFVQLSSVGAERGGVIIGNYSDKGTDLISIEVHTYGKIRLYMRSAGAIKECFFNVGISTTELTHVAVTLEENVATLYLNGVKVDSKTFSCPFPTALDSTLVVGGDRRHKNTQYFKGRVYSVALFDDVRTEWEIRRDAISVSQDTDGLLYARSYTSLESGTPLDTEMGITFTEKTYVSLDQVTKTPLTVEAIVALPKGFAARGGVIFGNYANLKAPQLNLEIYSNGAPRLYIHNGTAAYTYVFDADVRSDSAVHLAVVFEGRVATLYISGKAVDSVTLDCDLPTSMGSFKVGGDNRADNSQYFRGKIYALGLYGRAKTSEEIARDAIMMDGEDVSLMYLNYFSLEGEKEKAPMTGATFGKDANETVDPLSSVPLTFEATVRVPKEEKERVGIILGNYDGSTANQINLEIFPKGKVRLYFKSGSVKSQYVFKTDIRSDTPVHLAVTVDGRLASLYVDGVLAETATMELDVPMATEGFVIGGDRREGNEFYFRSEIFSVYLFADVRTADEIMADYLNAPDGADSLLYARNFTVTSEEEEPTKLRPMGQTFAENVMQSADSVAKTPYTFEAVFSVPTDFEGRVGTIVGNYDNETDAPLVNLELYSRGQLRLFYTKDGERVNCVFKADLRKGVPVHIAVTVDGLTATLYVNGVETQSKTLPLPLPEITSGYMIGGDHRYYNSQYFKGTLYSVALFGDVRTAEEILKDVTFVSSDEDALLYSTLFAESICNPYAPGFVHVESGWITDSEPSETQNGLKHKECVICGKTLVIQEMSSERTAKEYSFLGAEGLTFGNESDALVLDAFRGAPMTIEALIHLDPKQNQRAGVIFGSYDGTSKNGLNVEIFTNGRVRLYYKVGGVGYSYVFSADVRSEWLTHIAVTIDGLSATLYVNGEKSETLALDVAVPEITDGFRIGSDRRLSDGQYFKGAIYGVSLFEGVRIAEDIAMDAVIVSQNADGLLYSEYYVEKN